MLTRENLALLLVWNPRSMRVVSQWSPFKNGKAMFIGKDFHDVIGKLLGQSWEEKERGSYE